MQRTVDPDVLAGFIEEARAYCPTIRQGVDAYHADPSQPQALEEPHRLAHTIRGAAALVGAAALSATAERLEALLEGVAAGCQPWNEEGQYSVSRATADLEEGLNALAAGAGDNAQSLDRGNKSAGDDDEPEEEVAPELREVFLLEAEDHLRSISSLLPNLEQDATDRTVVQEIRRSAHTLKGAAAMVGFRAITRLAHRMEDLLDLMYEGSVRASADVVQLLFASHDALEDLAAGKRDQGALATLYEHYSQLLPAASVEPVAAPAVAEPPPAVLPVRVDAAPGGSADRRATPRRARDLVRVPIRQLDDLVKLVSEVVIARSTFEQRMTDFQRIVNELQPSSDRLKRAAYKLETQYEASTLAGGWLPGPPASGKNNGHSNGNGHSPANRLPASFRTHGFDDLELDRYTEFHLLSRDLAETTTDIQTVAGELAHIIGDFESYLTRQARLSSEIEDKLMRLRMVPLTTLASLLHRTVRTVAQQRGKHVELVLEGEHTELDKTVLEQMADPLLHLLRNAVDHGIETPEVRTTKGKTPRGVIRLRAAHEGGQVVLQISDDGAGIASQALRAAAVQRGFLPAAEAAALNDDQLRELVFLPGFTTAATVSEISGRGVGLDIVKAQVHRFKGTIALASRADEGTHFTIRLPMTLAITRALMVRANQERFAIPLDAVLQLSRIDRRELEQIGQETVVRLGGVVYPVLFLGKALGLKQPAAEIERPPVVLLNTGAKQVAVVVDELLGGREIVIKNLGTHLRQVRAIAGATVMGDGAVVLILNPGELGGEPAPLRLPAVPVASAGPPPGDARTIMIVDDSPSVRRVLAGLIRRAGWTPVTTKDGVEALETLHRTARLPDLILLDVEMPRMDGFELLTTLRGQSAYRAVPVVMVTSRTGDKHRRKALELGASGYVVKPYQDDVLLQTIRELTHAERALALV